MKRTLSMIGAALVLVAVLALGLPAQPAGAAKPSKLPDLQCGVAPTTDVVLRADLTCDTTLVIGGGSPSLGHTIDLGGHTWTSTAGNALLDRSGVTIKNGTIVGGIVADRWLFYSPLTLSRVHVIGGVGSGYYGSVDISHSETAGVSVAGYAKVHDSVVHGGISVTDTDQDAGFDIVGNTIEGGIYAGRAFDFNIVGGTIADNRIQGSSGSGIRLDRATGTISGNTISNSVGDGIEYHQGGIDFFTRPFSRIVPQLTVARNILRQNGGHGIDIVGSNAGEAAANVVDGGGNRANGNALDPQCIQIRCGPPDGRAIPTVTWSSVPDLEVGRPVGAAQDTAVASVPGTFTYVQPAGGAFRTPGYHTITVHFTPDDQVHFRTVDATTWVSVVYGVRTSPQLAWGAPTAIPFGTVLGPDQLNATTAVPGTFAYGPAAGTLLQPGVHMLNVSFVPDDLATYEPASLQVQIEVLFPLDESITWNPPPTLPFATVVGPDLQNATATVPGTFTYTPAAGTVLAPNLHQTLTAVFTPDDLSHYVVISKTVTVEVLPKIGPPGSVSFAPPIDTITGADIPTDTQLADLDGDGAMDLVSAHPTAWGHGASVQVRLGAGDGTFPALPSIAIPLLDGGHLVAVGDVNGDGHPDLVATNHSPDSISIMLGHGDGTFADRVDEPAGAGQGGLLLVDVDGDGVLDVVESNFWTPTVSVLLGHGDGTFGAKVDYPVGAGPMRLAATDLDGDGHVDLVVPNQFAASASVLMGGADGVFSPRPDLRVGHAPLGVAALDLDHDGHVDLAVTNSSDASVSILRGDGAGAVTGRTDVATSAAPGPIAAADLNGDGELDLAVGLSVSAAGAKSVAIWTGNGTLALGRRTDIVAGILPMVLAVGDVDGDGRPDLAVARPLAGKLSVVLNRTPAPS